MFLSLHRVEGCVYLRWTSRPNARFPNSLVIMAALGLRNWIRNCRNQIAYSSYMSLSLWHLLLAIRRYMLPPSSQIKWERRWVLILCKVNIHRTDKSNVICIKEELVSNPLQDISCCGWGASLLSSVLQGKCLNSTAIRPQLFQSKFFPVHLSSNAWLHIASLLKASLNNKLKLMNTVISSLKLEAAYMSELREKNSLAHDRVPKSRSILNHWKPVITVVVLTNMTLLSDSDAGVVVQV